MRDGLLHTLWERAVGGERDGIVPLLFLALLLPLSWIYGLGVRVRLWWHRRRPSAARRNGALVISVGNLTLGGTGKTPFVRYLAERIRDRGIPVAVIVQGYGRKAARGEIASEGEGPLAAPPEVGDEAYLLARQLRRVPVLVGKDRVRLRAVATDRFGSRVLILDDAFQSLGVVREIDIVLVDATRALRSDRLFPAGYLREPAAGLARASAVVATRVDQSSDEWARRELWGIGGLGPDSERYIECRFRPTRLVELFGAREFEPAWLSGKRLLALSAIGNPRSFQATLTGLGARVVAQARYPDHWWYRPRDLEDVRRQAIAAGAEAVVTTDKDAVRLETVVRSATGESASEEGMPPLLVLGIEAELLKGEEWLWRLIDAALREAGA
jgi:tetraacyldisaccharide 4'-kinase